MINIKRVFFAYIALFAALSVATAQEVGTDSPYGRYGYGILSNPAIGASQSMGGIGYGVRRSQHVNPANPASYSCLDTLTFIFDFGVSGHYTTLSDGTHSKNYWNGNLEYVAIQFPLFKNMGGSIGLLPYSKVGYNFARSGVVNGTNYNEIFNGSGGLSNIYAGIAYAPMKNISFGVNLGYLFGKIQHSRTLPSIGATQSLYRLHTNRFSINNLKIEAGAQFTYPIDKFSSATIGLVYAPKIATKSNVIIHDMLYDASGAQFGGNNKEQILQNDTLTSRIFEQPATYGIGVSYSNRHLLVGIDGTFQQWKNAKYPEVLDKMKSQERYNNRVKINAGIEYTRDPLNSNFFTRMRYRAGFSYANSYINTALNAERSTPAGYNEYGATVGLGLPFRNNFSGHRTMLNIGFGYTRLQPRHATMIAENLYQVTINMNINESWFAKQLFD